ncbi:MAG: hypothetical protein IJ610_09665 [Bacteroidaceae bacterium]|nr:hypothetical protein [Bacteroidaceae bacterium]
MENKINKQYYLPLLKEFCNRTISLYEKSEYEQGPFIPYVMSNYSDAPTKIMYVGRDTYYWESFETLHNAFIEGNLGKYLDANKRCVNVDKMLEWKNNSGSFWNMVNKLHLLIRKGEYISDITSIGNEEKNLLEEIGYGNLYSIEILQTLTNKYGDAFRPNQEYWEICKAAEPFVTLKSMIEAYNPDCVFVFAWIDKDDFFEGTDYTWQKDWYKDGFRAVYTSKQYHTKVIWTMHPRRFGFLQTSVEKMCHYLADTYHQVSLLK